MDNLKITTTIRVNGNEHVLSDQNNRWFTLDLKNDRHELKAVIDPVIPFELVDFRIECDYAFMPGDKFFSAGYQSWTTADEFTRGDIQRGAMAGFSKKLVHLSGISADDEIFGAYPRKRGLFHSITYTYIRSGDKLDLYGSMSEREGFTIIEADMNKGRLVFRRDTKGVFLVDKPYTALNIGIFSGGYDEVFDAWFKEMGIPKPRIDHMAGYTSWYNYYQKIDQNIILRDLNGLDRVRSDTDIFQVDDGFESYVGDWLDHCDKFPDGMGYIAEKIHAKGYKAGIWLAPFNVQIKSRTYKEHPEWVIRDENGKPVLGCVGWGGAYTLDIYKPGVREHIRHFFDVILNEWGFDMVKLDFLYSECHLPRNGKSRGTIMCEAVDFLRECCGDKLILGCGLPIGASFGKVDACRISCDEDLKFGGKFYNKIHVNNEVPSVRNAINNAVLRRHLNGRAFCSDPDVFYLRDTNLDFTWDQKVLLAKINNMFGDVLFVSDNVGDYSEKAVAVLREMFRKHDYKIVSAEYVSRDVISVLHDTDNARMEFKFDVETGEVLNNGAVEVFPSNKDR
ncbi:MAG: alpha-galactosidase [Clostridiales bacterium]|nr:alpha-galactosidase [Clostridiales bacterium]